MKINIEYDPNDPEDLILAEWIIKCNAMASGYSLTLKNKYNCSPLNLKSFLGL